MSSLLTTIITTLKTGSLKTVVARDDFVLLPTPPYVVVWESNRPSGEKNSTKEIFISVHAQVGDIETIQDYLETEVISLLHNKKITYDTTLFVKLKATNSISQTVFTNDDNTISKDRMFEAPFVGIL